MIALTVAIHAGSALLFLSALLGCLVFGFWGALLGTALGGLGGLFGSKAPKQTAAEKAATEQQTALNKELTTNLQTGRGYAAQAIPYGTKGYDAASRLYGQAEGAYTPAQNYFTTLMGGNRAATSAMLAPEITRIRDRWKNVDQATRQLNPRGGGTVSQAAETPFSIAREVGEIYAPARANAAAGLMQVGQGFGNLGQGQSNLGTSAFGAAGNFLNTSNQAGSAGVNNTNALFDYNNRNRQNLLNQQQYQYGVGKDIGGGMFNLLKGVNWGGIFKRGGGRDPESGE